MDQRKPSCIVKDHNIFTQLHSLIRIHFIILIFEILIIILRIKICTLFIVTRYELYSFKSYPTFIIIPKYFVNIDTNRTIVMFEI
jgi:hypothetical protein